MAGGIRAFFLAVVTNRNDLASRVNQHRTYGHVISGKRCLLERQAH
jgi:hypothetical protein